MNAPELLWFMDTLIRVRLSHGDGTDGVSILEQTARQGDSPPLHFHETEDETFHVLEGVLRFRIDGTDRTVTTGDTVTVRQGVPHTYRVESERGRWLVITAKGQFEAFVRTMARPADAEQLPPAGGPPAPEAIDALTRTAKRFGIEIIGPPLT